MKRRKRTRRKASSGLSANRSPKRTRTRRRRSGLSSGFNKASLMSNGKDIALGMAGGAIATQAQKLISGFKVGMIGKLLIGAGVGLVASSFGYKNLGVGFAGGVASLNFDITNLKEGEELEEDDDLSELPVYQTESGEFVKMLNDGELVPLSEEELSEVNQVYPQYGTMNAFQNGAM